MPTAAILIRGSISYRRDAFDAGLRRLGYDVQFTPQRDPGPGDLLVSWNRMRDQEPLIRRHIAEGAIVIIAENGLIGIDDDGQKFYCLSLEHHNGAGRWDTEDGVRRACDLLDRIDLKPWRRPEAGKHILVLPQRGIGEQGVAQPRGWTGNIVARLRQVTDRPLRIRPHPGAKASYTTPVGDLDGAWAAVVWASSAGIKSIVAGYPVFHEFKHFYGRGAARFGIEDVEDCFTGDRIPMLRDVACAQWSASEIATGEPFKRLIALHERTRDAA